MQYNLRITTQWNSDTRINYDKMKGKCMFKATKEIHDYLLEKDWKVFVEETDKRNLVWLKFGNENGGDYRINLISSNDDNDVSVRVWGFVKVNENQICKILPVINELNQKYRFGTITCDSDGDVNYSYTFLTCCTNPAESAYEIILRINSIITEAIPVLMHVIWA